MVASLALQSATFPGLDQQVRGPEGVREDGQHGVEAAVRDVDARVDHEDVRHVVDAAARVHDRRLRVVPHAAGARLVLVAGDPAPGPALVGEDRAGLLEPGLRPLRLAVADLDRVGVLVAGDAQDRGSPVVLHLRVELDPAVPGRDVLGGALDHHVPPVGSGA